MGRPLGRECPRRGRKAVGGFAAFLVGRGAKLRVGDSSRSPELSDCRLRLPGLDERQSGRSLGSAEKRLDQPGVANPGCDLSPTNPAPSVRGGGAGKTVGKGERWRWETCWQTGGHCEINFSTQLAGIFGASFN